MYCQNCQNILTGNENYCPNCGLKIHDKNIYNNKPIDITPSTENVRSASIILGGLALGGICLGIFAPVSLILSIIGLILALKANSNVKNTIGITLNAIAIFLSFIITTFIALVVYFIISESYEIPNLNYNHGDPIIEKYGEDF